MKKLNEKQEKEIILLKKQNYKNSYITDKYNIGVSTIYSILRRRGKRKIPNKKYKVNDKYFETLNNESSYWLGFLYADGYIRYKNNRSGELKLKLSIKDKGHIISFRDSLSSNHKLYEYNNSLSISIYNTKIVDDLVKLGCVNNKTFKIRLPKLKYMKDFIRGYFDGDGSIYKNKNRPNSFSIKIAGNEEFIKELSNLFKSVYNIDNKIYKQGKVFILSIFRINSIKLFRDLIYQEEDSIFLERKKKIFKKIC